MPGTRPVNTAFGLVSSEKVGASGPLTIVHLPVLGDGLLPCNVYVLVLHISSLGPGFDAVGGGSTVIVVMVDEASGQVLELCKIALY